MQSKCGFMRLLSILHRRQANFGSGKRCANVLFFNWWSLRNEIKNSVSTCLSRDC
jgi:hypothetical protein